MKEDGRYGFLRVTRRLVPMVLTSIPLFMLMEALLSAMNSSSSALIPFVTQRFLDAVQQVAVASDPDIAPVIGALGLLGAVLIANRIFEGTFHVVGRTMLIRMKGIFMKREHDKGARIDPAAYELPGTMDMINKAKEGAEHATSLVFILVLLVSYYVPYYAVMVVYLYSLKPILALALGIFYLPAMASLLVRSMVFDRIEDTVAPLRRRYEYYERTIADREFFKETRLLGAVPFFRGLYRSALTLFSREQGRTERKSTWIELGLHSLSLLCYFWVLLVLVQALTGGEITAGAFAAVFLSIGQINGTTHYLVTGHFGNISRNLGTMRNFLRFLDMPERQGSVIPKAGGGVRLRDACFRYPGMDRDAVSHVDLSIDPGETIAIVGGNGAGKTTLVRLMTGLYLPSGGSVQLRGVETGDIDPAFIYENTTAVFQTFQKYKLTLTENIAISDMKADHDQYDAVRAMEMADLSPEDRSFAGGMETMLSREFGGSDLSGGQWQRLAIARGLYRLHDFIVLDEPTAAIDPLEEQRIYQQFARLSQDKTAVIVTHRLGSTRLADRIVVMHEGGIEAVGSHEELLRGCSLYEQMWKSQAQWYRA